MPRLKHFLVQTLIDQVHHLLFKFLRIVKTEPSSPDPQLMSGGAKAATDEAGGIQADQWVENFKTSDFELTNGIRVRQNCGPGDRATNVNRTMT